MSRLTEDGTRLRCRGAHTPPQRVVRAGWAAPVSRAETYPGQSIRRARHVRKNNTRRSDQMTTTIWTFLSIFVIAPLGALAFDRPLFGNWIWRIDPIDAQTGLVTSQGDGLYRATPGQPSINGMSSSQMNSHADTNCSIRLDTVR